MKKSDLDTKTSSWTTPTNKWRQTGLLPSFHIHDWWSQHICVSCNTDRAVYTALKTIKMASNPQAYFSRNIGAWQRYPSSSKIIEALDERLVTSIEIVLTCNGGKTQPNCSYRKSKKIQGVYFYSLRAFAQKKPDQMLRSADIFSAITKLPKTFGPTGLNTRNQLLSQRRRYW